jgi:nucleotide-binding universal stress UspA family protein
MKNILVLIHDDAGQEARLQAALDLTRALDGHLICLDVVQLPVPVGDYVNESGQYAVLEYEREQEAANIARLRQRLKIDDVPFEIRQATGDFAESIERHAGLADLIVLNSRIADATSPHMLAVASHVLRKSYKPVVAIPEVSRGFDAAGNVLVAWDGSVPAMAALTNAVPLLQHAESVLLFEVKEMCSGTPIEEAAAYLSRHGIHPAVQVVEPRGRHTVELVQQAALGNGATYCVMGAYGHTSLREALSGGVTRQMLRTSTFPLFLAH